MKKLFVILIIMLFVFGLVACDYNPIDDSETPVFDNDNNSTPDDGNDTDIIPNDEDTFTVRLRYNEEFYIPEIPMSAEWSDGFSFHTAPFDENGVAEISGLDGDYFVTLSNLPEKIAYNPNIYQATNINNDIIIDLRDINYPRRTNAINGRGPYTAIKLSTSAVYQKEIESAKDIVYFEYTPRRSGQYAVSSWVSAATDQINPILDVYYGHTEYKIFGYTLDYTPPKEGKERIEGEYTRNFEYEVKITPDMVGNAFTFGIKATDKTGTYPAVVTFAITYEGTFDPPKSESYMVLPTEDFVQAPEYNSNYVWLGCESVKPSGSRYFDGSRYKLNPEDGYYHVYDEETDTYGEVLYAKITQNTRFFIDDSFSTLEYRGNKALTIGEQNYKLFIEGGAALVGNTPGEESYWQYQNVKGYADYCNSDGVYMVTAELKDFLQKYCISQRLFSDGNGWAETIMDPPVDAAEDDQWLAACGYYKLVD